MKEDTCRGCEWLRKELLYPGKYANLCTNAEMVKKIGGIKYRTIGTPGAESWVDADACERPAWCDRKEGMKHEITENEEINKDLIFTLKKIQKELDKILKDYK